MLTAEQFKALAKPFAPDEHDFLDGSPYIRKSAIRARLNEIDPEWSSSEPMLLTDSDDVVVLRGSITVGGVTHFGIGTGIIRRTKKVKKDNKEEIVPLTGFEAAREIAKAYKSAASDILPRAALEFNVGAYLKDKPRSVRQENFEGWLKILTGAPVRSNPPQSSENTLTPKPWATQDTVNDLLKWTVKSMALTWVDVSKYSGIAKSNDYAAWNTTYPTQRGAAEDIKAKHDAAMASLPPAAPKTPQGEEIPY